MRAYQIDTVAHRGALTDLPAPTVGRGEVLIRVEACGVCRTDLHVLDGELATARARVVPGHQIVGLVVDTGEAVDRARIGERVGVAWIGGACGACPACFGGRENLCPYARFTGLDRDGGFAELAVADAGFALPLPPTLAPVEAAPLLCAGAIGWRALRLAGDGDRVGLYGFGAAAHLLAQLLRGQGRNAYAFTRPGDTARQRRALALGAAWAGGSEQAPPVPLDAAILFAAAGELVPAALASVVPGGTVVCAEIHMSDIPSFPYALLWKERVLRSVANVTRADVGEVLALAARDAVRAEVTAYPLAETDRALAELRAGRVRGAAVILP